MPGYSGCGCWKVAKERRSKGKQQTFALMGKEELGEGGRPRTPEAVKGSWLERCLARETSFALLADSVG